MNRKEAFILLGLHEDATQKQVKDSYERWVKKYNAADYADDPEYVRKKKEQLKKAYNIASGYAPQDERFDHHDHDHQLDFDEDDHGSCDIYGDDERKASDSDDEFVREWKELGASISEGFNSIKEKISGEVSAGKRRTLSGKKYRKNNDRKPGSTPPVLEKISKIIAVLAILIPLATMCGEMGTMVSYGPDVDFETEDENVYISSSEDYLASVATDITYDFDGWADYGVYEEEPTDKAELKKLANEFAKISSYGEYETLGAQADYIATQYYDVLSDEEINALQGDSTYDKIEAVLNFYGFPPLSDVIGAELPDGDQVIASMKDYLTYINRYLENML